MSDTSPSGPQLADRGPTVFVVSLIMVVLATVFVAARIVSKWSIVRNKSPDDFLTIVAWIFCTALGISVMIGTQVGLGKTDTLLVTSNPQSLERCLYAFTVLYNPAIMATKTAILILYIRMFSAHTFLRYASFGTMAVVNVAGIVLTMINIFRCAPIRAAFTDTPGRCIDVLNLYLSSAPINILTDLAILLLPIPILTALRMEYRQKVILIITFIVGGFVTIVDVVRIVYLQRALEEELAIDGDKTNISTNYSFHLSYCLMWSSIEVSTGIICACVLVLKPLVLRVIPKLITSHKDRSYKDTQSENKAFSSLETANPSPITPTVPCATFAKAPWSPTDLSSGHDDDGVEMDFADMLASDENESPSFSNGPILGMSEPCYADIRLPPIEASAAEQDSMAVGSHSAAPPSPSFAKISRNLTRLSGLSHRKVVDNQAPSQTFYDFVEMGSKKPLTELSSEEAWWSVALVSSLFFLWGFSYGLLGGLNGEIQHILHYSSGRTIAIECAYWSAYLVGPATVGYWTLTRSGFKTTFITGLGIYACGAMAFWPSAVLRSFPGFVISNFIIAFGNSCLEISANPFVAMAGPGHLAEARLNFAQGIQAIGVLIAPMVAAKALFKDVGPGSLALVNVQWCYLAVALFTVALAVVIYYVPLSEASDEQFEAALLRRLANARLRCDDKVFGRFQMRTIILWVGALSVTCTVGSQEALSYDWNGLSKAARPSADPFWSHTMGHANFAIGRFVGSFLHFLGLSPDIVLAIFTLGGLICILLAKWLPPSTGALAALVLVVGFEAVAWPTVFATTMRSQGRHLKFASAVLCTMISTGVIAPAIVYGIDLHHNGNPRYAFSVTAVAQGLLLLVPIVWNMGRVRKWIDPKYDQAAEAGIGGEIPCFYPV